MNRKPDGMPQRCPQCRAEGPMLNLERVPSGQGGPRLRGASIPASLDLRCLACGWRRCHFGDRYFLPAQEPADYRSALNRR